LTRRLRAATRGAALLVMNGGPDLALAAGADGVHLKDESRRAAWTALAGDARSRLRIGRSVHDAAGAQAAEAAGADYLQLGTIYETASHPGEAGRGPELIRTVRSAVASPIVAVGGIDETNAGACMRAGASGVAVISAIGSASDPYAAARRLRAALEDGGNG
jgi:thiamine-phosphate pyrophosphorylase